ncbi:TPA: phage terminase large subunit family protein [Escherichia coli]
MLNQETAKAARTDSGYILRAPRRMRVADAVAQYMRVPMGAGNSVPWDPLVAPYVIEPMNCLASREYDAVIFVGPARTGKTIGLIDGWVIYNVICDPADMLIIQMTEEKAREHSKKRLARTFRVSPEVVSRLSPNKNDNNVYDRTFLAGNYLKIGWPSVNIMSSSDYKCVALTDYDRFPEDIDGEGDAFSLASKRTTTFMSSGMTLVESSPGRDVKDVKWRRTSPHEAPPTTGILSLYNRGDRRRWYWPCPHCGEYFQPCGDVVAGFRDIADPVLASEAAYIQCPSCSGRILPEQKRELNGRGVWLAASINIKPGHDYYFYIRSVNTVGKSAFVEAVGQPSDDASGYLDFFKGEIGKTHLAQELWTQIDNGQLAPDLAEIRTSITNVSNEITQTVNKKLEDQSAAIQQIQKVQVDTNNNLNSMWAVKLQQMQDGRLYIAGIGAGIENTPAGMQSQVLLAADRIAMINPANGNTKPMFVGQGDQIFMNDVFLKRLTAPTITSGGNPPAFSLTPDGRLTAKNADISGSVNANAGTLNNVTINENCRVLGKLSANQIEGDLVKTVGKAFPRDSRAPERWPSGTITVRVYDDQPFDRQIVIPTVAFRGAKHERENNDIYSSCRLIVKKNGAEIYNRTALDNTLVYTGVIDMPAGRGHMTLEFSVSAWLVNDWYPTASISDLLVVVMKKSTAGISIS